MRKEPRLPRVMIRCPMTGRVIETGLTADPLTWDSRPISLNRVSCPACKQVHAWSKTDAHLELILPEAPVSPQARPRRGRPPKSASYPDAAP